MRTPLGFTVCLALDIRTVEQFRRVWPTWRLHKPDLLDYQWLLIVDGFAGAADWWRRKLEDLDLPPHRLIVWNWPEADDAESGEPITQRERMLTAFVKVPAACCQTSHWIKIDTDSVATAPGPWIDRTWFDGSATPCVIANPWGYTKPARWPGMLQEWADSHPNSIIRDAKPLDLPAPEPGASTLSHRRIASWLCIMEMGFSKLAAQLCPGRLPVPSQDTYHWYVAARVGVPILRHRFKRHGWANVHSGRRRAELCRAILGDAGND